jgi:hypothetical protein
MFAAELGPASATSVLPDCFIKSVTIEYFQQRRSGYSLAAAATNADPHDA